MREYTREQRVKHLGAGTVAYWERVEAEAKLLASREDPKRVMAEKRRVDAYIYKSAHVEEGKRLATDDEVQRFFSRMGGYDDTPSIGHNSGRRDKLSPQGLD